MTLTVTTRNMFHVSDIDVSVEITDDTVIIDQGDGHSVIDFDRTALAEFGAILIQIAGSMEPRE